MTSGKLILKAINGASTLSHAFASWICSIFCRSADNPGCCRSAKIRPPTPAPRVDPGGFAPLCCRITSYNVCYTKLLRLTVGDSLIDAENYVGAVNKFVEGYVFYKQEFDEGNSPELVNGVNRSLSSVASSLLAYAALQAELAAAADTCAQALSSVDLALVDSSFPRMLTAFASLAQVRNAVADAGWFFEDTFAQMQIDDTTLTENSFLPFAQRFTLGRKTAGRYEGVLGAMDAQWVGIAQRLDRLARERLLAYWNAGNPLSAGVTPLAARSS